MSGKLTYAHKVSEFEYCSAGKTALEKTARSYGEWQSNLKTSRNKKIFCKVKKKKHENAQAKLAVITK